MPSRHICICICTFRRAELLRRLLVGIEKLNRGADAFSLSCVVVDNDADGSARPTVEAFTQRSGIAAKYVIEPVRNFAQVRNRAVECAVGDYIAFIDDDEIPIPHWLSNMHRTLESHRAIGVLGPVRPYFDDPPPQWILKGKMCDRLAHPTGTVMKWQNCRTGNVLLKREIFGVDGMRFDLAYGTGGEDVDFFKRAVQRGHQFVWCEEAPAYELVPPERFKKSYFLRRALLQGRVSLKYATVRLTPMAKVKIAAISLTALALYLLAMPALLLAGFHTAMKYLIKWCHHFGRLCALLGINLVPQRNF